MVPEKWVRREFLEAFSATRRKRSAGSILSRADDGKMINQVTLSQRPLEDPMRHSCGYGRAQPFGANPLPIL